MTGPPRTAEPLLEVRDLKVSFGPVAVHYKVGIDICPSRHAWRKGAVEKGAHTLALRKQGYLDETTSADLSQERLAYFLLDSSQLTARDRFPANHHQSRSFSNHLPLSPSNK